VLTTLKSIGIQDCDISFPTSKKRNRGFAFLKFASHYYARAAFRQLIKPDAFFGTDRSAKVSFHQSHIKPSENLIEVSFRCRFSIQTPFMSFFLIKYYAILVMK